MCRLCCVCITLLDQNHTTLPHNRTADAQEAVHDSGITLQPSPQPAQHSPSSFAAAQQMTAALIAGNENGNGNGGSSASSSTRLSRKPSQTVLISTATK